MALIIRLNVVPIATKHLAADGFECDTSLSSTSWFCLNYEALAQALYTRPYSSSGNYIGFWKIITMPGNGIDTYARRAEGSRKYQASEGSGSVPGFIKVGTFLV